MESAAPLNGIAEGAPVLILPGTVYVHIPTVHRLGRGTWKKPLSQHLRDGGVPLYWTTVCGHLGVVVENRSVVAETPVCPECLTVTLRLS